MADTASVPAREYDMKGVASLISAPNTGTGFELPFVVQGPWDDPLIFPDPESLIRRVVYENPLKFFSQSRNFAFTPPEAYEAISS